jgi:integrase
LLGYAAHLRKQIQQGEICIATAQNHLNGLNRTLAALRGDQCVKIASPSKLLGLQRSSIRTRSPDGQDLQQVKRVIAAPLEQQHHRVAAIVYLARVTGMRLREAILADLPRLQREAKRFGRINIQDGAKGGRSGASAPRWIAANEEVKEALQMACHASPASSRNLLAQGESYATFLQQTVRPAGELLQRQGVKGFHELRAAYACKRYEQLTGHDAPVNGGHCYRMDHDLDRWARQRISAELGHNRVDVVSTYIGGRT